MTSEDAGSPTWHLLNVNWPHHVGLWASSPQGVTPYRLADSGELAQNAGDESGILPTSYGPKGPSQNRLGVWQSPGGGRPISSMREGFLDRPHGSSSRSSSNIECSSYDNGNASERPGW